MSEPTLDPDDTEPAQAVETDADETLPPEHPAGSDDPVSAGEVLSGEGPATSTMPGGQAPTGGGPVDGRPDDGT